MKIILARTEYTSDCDGSLTPNCVGKGFDLTSIRLNCHHNNTKYYLVNSQRVSSGIMPSKL